MAVHKRSSYLQKVSLQGGLHRRETILMMAATSKKLTREELASLLKVGNTSAVLEPPAAIPAEHSARLIELGYIAHLEGRLRMTAAGRYRIAAAENQNRSAPKAIN
jgi:hypothetical protein